MSKLKEIMVQYATQRGGGLPLTPEEMCNAVVLWVDSLVGGLSIEGGYLVQVQKEGTQYTININTEQLDADIKGNYFNANDLSELFEGSETVVVDVNEAGNKIEIHLDSEVVSTIARAVLTPLQAPEEPELAVLGVDNAIRWEPVSSFVGGGGTQLYLHKLYFSIPQEYLFIISTKSEPFTTPATVYTRFNKPDSDIIRFWANNQSVLTGGNVLNVVQVDEGQYACEFKNNAYTLGSSAFDSFTDTVTPL